MRTQRKQPRRQHGTKVEAHPYKSFGQAFSKACGNPKGKARGRLRRGETPLRSLTNKAKLTVKPSQKKKTKKRNAAQKGKIKRSNENHYLRKTVNLHCAYSILLSNTIPFPNLRAKQSKFGKRSKIISELNSATKPNRQIHKDSKQNYAEYRRH